MIDVFETCQHCENENAFQDVPSDVFKVKCVKCGREMMLCNKCYELNGICDWHKTPTGGKCYRGETKKND